MNNEQYKLFFDYLIKLTDGKLFLNTKQLEKVTGILVKQQSILRLKNELPIKFKTIGKIVYYSIDDVIKFMLCGEVTKEERPLSDIVLKKQSKPLFISKKKSSDRDLSHLFNLRAFSVNLGVEIAELTEFKESIDNCIKTTELYYELEYALLYKEIKKKVQKE